MRISKKVITLLLGLLMTGCVKVNLPELANYYPMPLNIKIVFDDNQTKYFKLKSYEHYFVGNDATILKLKIYNDKKTLFNLDKNGVKQMIEIQKETSKSSSWVIDKDGLNLKETTYKKGGRKLGKIIHTDKNLKSWTEN